MRLLRSRTLQFENFYGDAPPYAILSHSWGKPEEEATFQDLRDGTGIDKPGYIKIKTCCTQAIQDSLEFVWIDTCCIDKTNSVELQEAINSMFSWYKLSKICYVYLSDYSVPARPLDVCYLQASRWFTRGWTLQELIAPAKVVFYNRDWENIGSRADLSDLISTVTRISPEVLAGQDLELSSISQRMSWASARQTTRAEDIAYCLLGIFGITMPLIYGEGGREAFIRLQKCILEKSDDHSLFAWKQQQGLPGHGLLASSPALFAGSSSIVQIPSSSIPGFGPRNWYSMTNRGLRIKLWLCCTLYGGDYIALLDCKDSRDGRLIVLHLSIMDDGRFIRTHLNQLGRVRSLQELLERGYRGPIIESLNDIYIPQLYLPDKPREHEYYFQVLQADSKDKTYGFSDMDPALALGIMKGITFFFPSDTPLLPSSQTKLPPVGFRLAAATSPGRLAHNDSLDFKLKAGGLAGVLFVPSHTPMTSILFPSSKLQFVGVVFGVHHEGSVYGDIILIGEESYKKAIKGLRKDKPLSQNVDFGSSVSGEVPTCEWFEMHLLDDPLENTSEKKLEKEIGELTFRMEIKMKSVGRERIFEVSISYRPQETKKTS